MPFYFKNVTIDWASLKLFFYSQFDFTFEAINMLEFIEYYKEEKNIIKIPQPFFSKKDILIMEYIECQPMQMIHDHYILFQIYECLSLTIHDQICNRKKSHGDFHPGNFGVIIGKNKDEFKIVFYDFGLVMDYSLNLEKLCLGSVFNDEKMLIESFMSIFKLDTNAYPDIQEKVKKYVLDDELCFTKLLTMIMEKKKTLEFNFDIFVLLSNFMNTQNIRNHSLKSLFHKTAILEKYDIFPILRKKYMDYIYK
jgi:hypothetical protein